MLENYGAPGEIRTPDHLVRSQVLYPTELRAREGTVYRARHVIEIVVGRVNVQQNAKSDKAISGWLVAPEVCGQVALPRIRQNSK